MRFELIDPSRIIGMDLAKTIRRGIKSQAEPMRDTELGRVIDRTPQLTGALRADETGTYSTDPDNPEIIHLTVGSEHQLAAVAFSGGPHVYAEFQELGSPNNPYNQGGAHMFGKAETEDLDIIEAFGVKGVNNGINDIVNGNGYRL